MPNKLSIFRFLVQTQTLKSYNLNGQIDMSIGY